MRTGENIHHRRDGRWEGRSIKGRKEDGKASYGYVYGHTYQEVKEERRKRIAELESSRAAPCKLTMNVLCLQWLSLKRRTVKEASYYHYEQLIQRHIEPVLGHLRADTLTANALSRFMNDKLEHGRLDKNGGLSPKTVQDIMIVVKSVLKLAAREYGLPDRTVAVKLPRTEQKEIEHLNSADMQKLERDVRAAQDNSSAGLRLCLHTGLRLGEVCALRWSDIDWENGVLHVRRTVRRLPCQNSDSGPKTRLTLTRPKTKQSERAIPLPLPLLQYLRTVALDQDANAYVTTGVPGHFMDPRTYQYRFRRLLEKLEIAHISFHGLRHTFATHCIQQGMDVKSLSEILGHATVEMTMNRYVHSSLEVKRSQMERLTFAA